MLEINNSGGGGEREKVASSSPADGGGAALRQGGPLGSKVLWEAGAGSPKALHKPLTHC